MKDPLLAYIQEIKNEVKVDRKVKHMDLQKRVQKIEKKQAERFPHLIERIEQLETDVKALKMEHDILYANSLKTDD